MNSSKPTHKLVKKAIEAELKRRGLKVDDHPPLDPTDNKWTPDYVKGEIAKFWTPHAGKQTEYFLSKAFELFFGGAAGGGKTDCLLIDALEQIWHPRYNAIIFRRTFADLRKADGLIERSKLYYPKLGGKWNGQTFSWTFPSGAKIFFGGLEHEDDKLSYQGTQFQFIAFDELTHFTETQFLYLFSRCRLPDERETTLKLKIRCTSNPGGSGHGWVKERYITQDISSKTRFFARIKDVDTRVKRDHPDARTRRFIFATHKDNPAVGKEYIKNLNQLPEIERKWLLEGDWDADFVDGIYSKWSSRENIRQVTYDPAYPVKWAVDDGFDHPRAILFIQERPYNGIPDCICVFDEIFVKEELPELTIQEALDKPYKRPEIVVYDPSATQFAARARIVFSLSCLAANNDVPEGIKAVRGYISHDKHGLRRLFVDPRCKNLIREFPLYRYNKKGSRTPGGDFPPVKENDHALDALRYYIYTLCRFKN